jgi:hypothetical protein
MLWVYGPIIDLLSLPLYQDRLRQAGLDTALPSEGSATVIRPPPPRFGSADIGGQGTAGPVIAAAPFPAGVRGRGGQPKTEEASSENRARPVRPLGTPDELVQARMRGQVPPHLRMMSAEGLKEELRRVTATELNRIIELPEDSNAVARATLHELKMPPELVEYAMQQRERIKPPRAGTPAYQGLTAWWTRITGIHVD